jgi:large subunit ribosomal protein L25
MASDTKVHAELRENFGKGFARRLRAAGQIPAVIYGHGSAPVHVALPGHQMSLLVRRANAVLEMDVNGKTQLTLVKDVQRDPVRQVIEHIDLLVVKKGEKIEVEVPVVVVGESAPGTMVNLDMQTLRLEVEATHIPEHVEVDVTGREEGDHVTAGGIALPSGASLIDDPELLIVAVSVPSAAAEPETEGADEEAAAEAAPAEEAAAE